MTAHPSSRTVPIVLIIALALALRLTGIEWGLPNALHALSYHPDETVMLMHSTSQFDPAGLNVLAGRFLPHFYHYGSLQLVLINIAIGVATAYARGAFLSGPSSEQLLACYLTGRILTALMGVATVWALWAFGRRAYSEATGLCGALLLALAPLHVQHSHFMTVDVPATLWIVLSLLWGMKSLAADGNKVRALTIAGCFSGLAAATKYNCALVLLSVIAAALTGAGSEGVSDGTSKAKGVIAAIAAAGAAYFIGCPGTLLEHRQFVSDFMFEARHVSSQQELWFQGTGVGWWYVLRRNLGDGLGWPLLAASLCGAIYAARKRAPGDLLTLVFALPYYLLVGAAQSRYARYEIPLLPVFSLWAARLLVEGAQNSRALRTTSLVASTLIAIFTAISAILIDAPFITPDPRDRAEAWILTNIPAGSTIGIPVQPWFWTPPICPYFSMPGPAQWLSTTSGQQAAQSIVTNPSRPFDGDLLRQYLPPFIVMSEYEYFDRLRLHDPAALEYISVVRQHYGKPIVFADDHWLGGRRSIDGLPCQDLPHDMLYSSPTTLIFKRLY